MRDRLALKDGYINHYLISGPLITAFENSYVDKNQLKYEEYLRTCVVDRHLRGVDKEIQIGKESSLGLKWAYYYATNSVFVDKSAFYSKIVKVEMLASTVLVVEKDRSVEANIWSYGAIELWINDTNVLKMGQPTYYQIAKEKVMLHLKQGENRLFINLQNLGVRDTRNVFGIQLLNDTESIKTSLSNIEACYPCIEAAQWLDEIKLEQNRLVFEKEAQEGTTLIYDTRNPDLEQKNNRYNRYDISKKKVVQLEDDMPFIEVSVQVDGQHLTRNILRPECVTAYYREELTVESNLQKIYEEIEKVVKLDRGENIGFSMFSILARKAIGASREDDGHNIYETLNQIESRIDCADFVLAALLRYAHLYQDKIDDKLNRRMREVLLGFRYWMDEAGFDCMCFWSENHSLFFYSSAMQAGKLYPNDVFVRSGKTGETLHQEAKEKVEEWLDDAIRYGFEEFLSGSYVNVTFAALLNVIDFADKQISDKAMKLLDQLFEMIVSHTFKGVVIAPQGRVYSDVIFPYVQSIQTLVNLINPKAPATFGEGWLGFYAKSKYKAPYHLAAQMNEPIEVTYTQGNGKIHLNKQSHYIMTSVESPKESDERIWLNKCHIADKDINNHSYIKSMNEVFHGTTFFAPGEKGYQQHLWTAAIAQDTLVFVNHPGSFTGNSSLRPGYWFGNGVFPALRQQGQAIGSIYIIPKSHPVKFTHIYWPSVRFQQMQEVGHWLIGKKEEGYIGLWSNKEKETYDDQMFNAEYRVNSEESAYVCVCSDIDECENLEAFLVFCQSYRPRYDSMSKTLYTDKNLKVVWKKLKLEANII